MTVRLRRLQSDYEAVRRLARLHPRVHVEGVVGRPPERYRLVLTVRSLREKGGRILLAQKHRLEITLPHGYPRDAPICRMLTPVFHPNIAPHVVCIGDHWSAAESLDLMIQRVGEMLAFQSYNVKSPLNGAAAKWVEENIDRLPTDRQEFFVDLVVAERDVARNASRQCSNCGAECDVLEQCGKGHRSCPDCVVSCERCSGLLCLTCGTTRCETCEGPVCSNCEAAGASAKACSAGLHSLCIECAYSCEECDRPLCLMCAELKCPACA